MTCIIPQERVQSQNQVYNLGLPTSVPEPIEEQIGDTDEPSRHCSVSLIRPAGMSVIGGGAKFELLKVTALRETGLVDAGSKANPHEATTCPPGDLENVGV